MSKRTTDHTLEEKLNIVLEVINSHRSISSLSKNHGVSIHAIKQWVNQYEVSGEDGLKESRTWQHYSRELKLNAVHAYLDQQGSHRDICRKYNISDTKVLRQWIRKYTGGEQLQTTGKGRSTMTRGRKTTFKERLEIVQHILANDSDYQGAAEKYEVSYQQAYTWVRKYREKGKAGLEDRRGKGLDSKAELTEEEKFQLRIRELEHRNQYLEVENGLLKKLKEIERRDQ